MRGRLAVFTGPMGSGKTLELIRRMKQHERRGEYTLYFKHSIDDRDGETECKSRCGLSFAARPVGDGGSLENIVHLERRDHLVRVVAVEEAQFFSDSIIDTVEHLLRLGIDVYLTGLSQDSRGNPFGPMPILLAVADEIVCLPGICAMCGAAATKTQALFDKLTTIEIGGDDKYEARCVDHWEPR